MTITDPDYDVDTETDDDEQEQQRESDDIRKLRKLANAGRKAIAERDELKAKLDGIERDRSLKDAFGKLGIDTTKGAGKLLAKGYDGEATPEALRAFIAGDSDFASMFELPPDPTAVAAETSSRIASAMAGGEPAGKGQLDPKTAATWPMDQQLRFKNAHPEAWEALLRGEQVTTPAGWA